MTRKNILKYSSLLLNHFELVKSNAQFYIKIMAYIPAATLAIATVLPLEKKDGLPKDFVSGYNYIFFPKPRNTLSRKLVSH